MVLLVVTGACGSTTATERLIVDDGRAYVPPSSADSAWRTASPASVGLDGARIRALQRNVATGRYGSIDGFVIIRYGYVAVEQYQAWTREQPHTMQSVTKSVVSLLYGIMATHGAPQQVSLDRPVLGIFTRLPAIANVDDRKRALTLRHLLTMRTGMDFWEQPYAGSPLDQLNRSGDDWVKFILDRPMTGDPGGAWAYNSGAAILMGAVVRELSGENLDVFARRELFAPIGVAGETWYRSPYDGLPHGGGGLSLKALDLARVGYLVLRKGKWGERLVVLSSWVEESTQPVVRGPPVFFSAFGSGYGDFWWLFPTTRGGTDSGVIAASGSGGQWLFVIPSLDLVVVVIAQNGDGLDLLYNELLPAVVK
jgi:CubicO group peptidase (beta-lactamase class C family)